MGRSYCFAKSRNIWATARFVKWVATGFFTMMKSGLNRSIGPLHRARNPQKSIEGAGRSGVQYGALLVLYRTLNPQGILRRPAPREPALANSPTWDKIAAQKFSNGESRYEIRNP